VGSSNDTALTLLTAVTPVLVLLLGGLGWLYKHERERRAAAEQQVSERKYQAYVTLMNIFFEQFKTSRHGQRVSQDKLADLMADANKDLMLFGSDDVLRLYQNWLYNTRRGLVDMEQFGGIIVAIRKDMGHHNTSITSDEVLRQLITDYDKAKAEGTLQRIVPAND
jgi:hypothetical protein